MTQPALARPTRITAALLGGAILFLAYFIFYSPRVRSDDELYIIDTVDTIAVRDHPYLNQTSYLRGIQRTDVEPAQPLLAVPLYWLAYHIPWVGNVHALFLFNPLMTALIGLVFFLFALDLGYRTRTALAGMLLLGLGTILVPYAQTFLREPLTTLNLLGAAFCLNRWRLTFGNHERRHWPWLAAGVIFTMLALLSKEAALIMLPYFILIALPGSDYAPEQRRALARIAVGVAVLGVLFTLSLSFFRSWLVILTGRYELLTRLTDFTDGLPHAWWGLTGYLLMPGRSIFFFSPILILALGAPAILPRARWRETWLQLGLMVWFALAYAAVRRFTWYGGADWGARYMVPLAPFLMLAALPLVDRMLNAERAWPRIALVALAAISLLVQVGGSVVNVHAYYDAQAAATGLPFWKLLWNVRWSQPLGSILYLPQAVPENIWLFPSQDWPALIAIGVGLVALTAGLIWVLRDGDLSPRVAWIAGALAVLVTAGITLFGLWRAFDSPYHKGDRADLHQLLADLEEQGGYLENIVLSTPTYADYFANYYKGPMSWYVLPPSPGETYSPDVPPAITSDVVEDLVSPEMGMLAEAVQPYRLFDHHRPAWLVEDQASYLPWAVRPIEWYFSKYAFPGTTTDYSNGLRLVQIITLWAPQTTDPPAAEVDARFGDHITLIGYDMLFDWDTDPADPRQAGNMVGVSLLWESDAALDVDYTTAVYFIGADGVPVMQVDHRPLNGFAPTTSWLPGEPVRDNFGFEIGQGMAPGEYEIWVVIYSWPSLERLPVGVEGADHLVLTTIHAE